MPQPFSVRGEQEEQASDDNDDDESQKPVQTEPPVLAQDERSESQKEETLQDAVGNVNLTQK